MDKAKVYYCDFTATADCNLLQKLEKLIKTAGIETIDFKDKFTAIKIHFGEPGNLSYLRPNYAKVLVDLIKKNSRHYAKRQLTWFRRDKRIKWFDRESDTILSDIENYIDSRLV